MNILGHVNEIRTAPYYRRRPVEAIRYAYAKWQFARNRVHTPQEFLRSFGISVDEALKGYSRWKPLLNQVIERVRRREEEQGLQGGVTVDDGIALYGLVRTLRPEYVIETGVAAGVSNSFINAALVDNGRGTLYSIDLPPDHSAAGRHQDGGLFAWPKTGIGWAVPTELRNAIGARNVLILEDIRTALPKLLPTLPRVDLFFHDDLHTPDHMLWEYETVWPHLAPNGFLVSDDSNYGWIQFCRRHGLTQNFTVNLPGRLTGIRKC